MDAASVAQFWSDLPKEISEESIIAVAKTSSASPEPTAFGYTMTAVTADNPPKTANLGISQLPKFLEQCYFLSQLPPHLHLPPADIHIVISTKSGAEQAAAVFNDVLKPVLKTVGLDEISYQVLRTESSDTVRDFAGGRLKQRADEGVAQTVVLLSGDGGVVDVVNGLMNNGDNKSNKFIRPTIVLIPLGTGNALFHSLHRPLVATSSGPTPTDLTLALRTLLFGTPSSLPIFRTTFSPDSRLLSNYGRTALPLPPPHTLYGAIVASYGLHATLVADSDTASWRQHGSARFGMVARELLASPHAYRAKLILTTGGKGREPVEVVVDRSEHGYILLTLVSNLEKTFTISPAREPLDGKLRVVHFGPEEGEEVGRLMGLAYQCGKHIGEERVGYEEVKGMRIEFLEEDEGKDGDEMKGRWRRVCIDGLIVRVEEGGWVEVAEVAEAERAVDVVVARGVVKA